MERLFDIRYLIGVMRRRWLLLLLPIMIGAPLSLAIAYILPPVYLSSAQILVESQQIPSDLARSTVSASMQERIIGIEQRLKSRANMIDLARRFEVFPGQETLSATQLADMMRKATTIRSLGETGRARRTDTTVTSIAIEFRASRASVAVQVANELLTQVLSQNIAERSERATETLAFFSSETQRLAAALEAYEARISAFKSENDLALPENADFRRTEFTTLQNEAFLRERQRLALEESKRTLEDAIALGRSDTRDLSPEEVELRNLRRMLASQSAIFAPNHPTIRTLQARIDAIAASATTLSEPGEEDDAAPLSAAGRELERIDAELALLEQQNAQLEERVDELRDAISAAPQIEIQLGALTREFESLQRQYAESLSKQAEAAVGERIEANRQGERLEVIEQPQMPEEPVRPNRILIAAAGGMFSIALSLGLTLLVELLNPALRSVRDLERELQLRPVVVVPYLTTDREQARSRWTLRLAVLVIVVALPLLAFLIDRYFLPLPVLAERLMEKSGLDSLIRAAEQRLGR